MSHINEHTMEVAIKKRKNSNLTKLQSLLLAKMGN